ncbi:WD domain [Cryptosporidium sp. chipmunk genotype I]|uniref:WD domain n=1 Tax=Cryptosporidium sp. chipmunk genotype I TaxID=1280935 RepID=UPI00351A6A45|nr:WD domain [Cryptosporidium sp. chipmunk genotype I]
MNDVDNRHFGVGLYCLEDAKSQHRIGGINIYDIQSVLETHEYPNYCSETAENLEHKPKMYINAESGVVNFEWDPKGVNLDDSDLTHITCLCSDKSLKLFRIEPGFSSYKLLSSVKSESIDNNNHIIGLDLSCIYLNGTRKTCYSISDGRVFIIRNSEVVENEFYAHPNTEVWTVSFLDQEGNLLATGADDCFLSLWDLRTSCINGPVIKNKKSHSMGVTCIQKSNRKHQFWSGSYDETLRFWDFRMLNSPIYEYRANGGIWRLNQFEDYLGMAQCYYGLEYLKLDSNLNIEKQLVSVPNNSENEFSHNSIVYGIDTFRVSNTLFSLSCSFYDKTAFIFQILED